MNRFLLIPPSFGKLPDGGFDVAAQLVGEGEQFHFLAFLGRVRVG